MFTFIRRAGIMAVFAAVAFFSAHAASAAPVQLKFANFPAASTFPCISMERWVEELIKRTDGAVAVTTYPAGTLVDARNMLRAVRQGQADIGCISLAYFSGAFPMMSAFELPLGFTSAEAATEGLLETYAAFTPKEFDSVKVISLFASAPSQVLSTKPVPDLASLKGLRLRAAGQIAQTAKAMGASAVSMPQSETPEALQKGVVEGVLTSLDVMQDYNYAEYCRHVLTVNASVYPFAFIMNKKTWDGLPQEVQKAIDELNAEHSLWTGRYVDGHGRKALAWSRETYGVTTVELSLEDAARMDADLSPLKAEWVKKNASKGFDPEKVLGFIEDIRKRQIAR